MFKRHHQVFTAFRVLLDVATVLAGLLLVAVTYFVREDRYSRGALLIFTVPAFVGVGAMRFLFKEVLQALRRRGYNLRYVLVLGAGRLARQALEQIEAHRELGFRPVGCLSLTRSRVGQTVDGTEVIGTVRDLREA